MKNYILLSFLFLISNLTFSQKHEIFIRNNGNNDIYVASAYRNLERGAEKIKVKGWIKIAAGKFYYEPLQSWDKGDMYYAFSELVNGKRIPLGIWLKDGGYKTGEGYKLPVTTGSFNYEMVLKNGKLPQEKIRTGYKKIPFTIYVRNKVPFNYADENERTKIYFDDADRKRLDIELPFEEDGVNTPYHINNAAKKFSKMDYLESTSTSPLYSKNSTKHLEGVYMLYDKCSDIKGCKEKIEALNLPKETLDIIASRMKTNYPTIIESYNKLSSSDRDWVFDNTITNIINSSIKIIKKAKTEGYKYTKDYVSDEYASTRRLINFGAKDCSSIYSYRVKIINIKYYPPKETTSFLKGLGTYEFEIEHPLYKNISSKVFKKKDYSPKSKYMKLVNELMTGKRKSIYKEMIICEDNIFIGEFEIGRIKLED